MTDAMLRNRVEEMLNDIVMQGGVLTGGRRKKRGGYGTRAGARKAVRTKRASGARKAVRTKRTRRMPKMGMGVTAGGIESHREYMMGARKALRTKARRGEISSRYMGGVESRRKRRAVARRNPWIDHVKDIANEQDISYAEALKLPETRRTYLLGHRYE